MSVTHETFTYTDDEARLAAFRYDEAIESAWEHAHLRGRVPDLEGYYRVVLALRNKFRIGEYEAPEEASAQERGWKTQKERMANLGCVPLSATIAEGSKVFYFRTLFVVKSVRPLESHEQVRNRTVAISLVRAHPDGSPKLGSDVVVVKR